MQEQKEKPILFNTEMVKAVLSGRKTQTRRVIKPQPPSKTSNGTPFDSFQETTLPVSEGYDLTAYMDNPLYIGKCPYGQVGDRLWVRETWQSDKDKTKFIYKADYSEFFTCDNDILFGWKPSIHMLRRASRINLEIVDIGIERVQDIDDEDSIKEGALFLNDPSSSAIWGRGFGRACFRTLWESINEKRGYGWDVNPWVWVVEFKVIK
jgi:hypothetical protein